MRFIIHCLQYFCMDSSIKATTGATLTTQAKHILWNELYIEKVPTVCNRNPSV